MLHLRLLVAAAASLATAAASAVEAPARMADGVLVASNGRTLYTFDNDPAGSGGSVCNGGCAALWPPLQATAAEEASVPWGVVTRDDGSRQWSYRGKPLYFYQGDQKAGDRSGDNVKSVWHVVRE